MDCSPGEVSNFTNGDSKRSTFQDQDSLARKSIIWDEDYFHEILSLERKRTERSGKSLILMLLNINAIGRGEVLSHYLASNLNFLSSITRETDIKGWYEHGCIVGVLFTEIGETDANTAKDTIAQKVRESLKEFAGIDHPENKGISFKVYPETAEARCRDTSRLPINLRTLPHDSCTTTLPGAFSHFLSGLLRHNSLLFLGDVILILAAQFLAVQARFGFSTGSFQDYTIGFSLEFLLFPAALFIFDLYNVHRRFQSREALLRMAYAGALVMATSAVFFYTIPQLYLGRGLLAYQMMFLLVLLTGWRLVYGIFFQAAKSNKGTLIIGAGKSGKAAYRLLKTYFSQYEVKGFIDDNPAIQGKVMGSPAVVGTSERLLSVADKMGARTAILAVGRKRTPQFTRTILEARLGGMEIIELPALYERITGRVPVEIIEDQWLLFSEGFQLLSREYVQRIKRLMDFTVAGLLLLATMPLMAITALAIYAESPGPVFYRQNRVGYGGRVFRVSKFRSMRLNAEKDGAQWAQKHDDRVTRVGKWIRLLRIDELPQIWNVFLGEMSLVGPRPERPEFVQELEKMIPYYSTRHSVAPGITGWAQVNYPYGASVEDSLRKLEFDLYYVKNMSILLDVKILLKTVGVVLLGQGAR